MLSNFDIFSDHEDLSGSPSYEVSDIVDVGKFAGKGEPIDILVRVTADFAGGTSLTVAILESATVGGSYTETMRITEIPLASLVQGYEFKFNYLPKVTKRFVRMVYTRAGTFTAGSIFAAVEAGEDKSYEDGLYFSPRNPTGAR